MKKIISICVLLLSLVGCANNVTSSSACPCEDLLKENKRYSFEDITTLNENNFSTIYEICNVNESYKIDEQKYIHFYNFMNRDFYKTKREYIDENYLFDDSNDIIWGLVLNDAIHTEIGIYQIFDNDGNSKLILIDSDTYITSLITKEENEMFFDNIGN